MAPIKNWKKVDIFLRYFSPLQFDIDHSPFAFCTAITNDEKDVKINKQTNKNGGMLWSNHPKYYTEIHTERFFFFINAHPKPFTFLIKRLIYCIKYYKFQPVFLQYEFCKQNTAKIMGQLTSYKEHQNHLF